MQLVNLDGLVILGPGSEWFWTMLSGIFVPITFYLLYRQLRLQASTASIEQVRRLAGEWDSEEMAMSALEVHDAFITKRLSDVVVMRAPRRNGHPDPYRVPHGTTEFHYYLRFHLKADHLSKPDEPPTSGGNTLRMAAWTSW